MTPEYLEQLADLADPDQLWRLSPFVQMELPPEKRAQLDTGVALRRHASDVRRLRSMIGTGKSLLITPLSDNGRHQSEIDTPAKVREWMKRSQVPR